MLVLHGKNVSTIGNITVGAVGRVMRKLIHAHIIRILNGRTCVLGSRERTEAILVVILLVDEAVTGANLVEDFVGLLIGCEALVLKINAQAALLFKINVLVYGGEPTVTFNELRADLTINDVEVLAHL